MPAKITVPCLLTDEEWGWLTASAANSGLPDEGKAFRCCVNFLAQGATDAVAVGTALAAAGATERPIELAGSQSEWMATASVECGFASVGAFASAVKACVPLDPAEVFGVIRCKTATGEGAAGVVDASTACAGAQQALAAAEVQPEPAAAAAAPTQTGCVVDCGSGHTSVMFYSTGGATGSTVRQLKRGWFTHADGGNLPITDILPDASGGAFQGTTLEARLEEFIANLNRVLKDEDISGLSSLFVGATGGMRECIAEGKVGEAEIGIIRCGFETAFASEQMSVVKFEVLTGDQEATWEHDAAQIIWGGDAAKTMFRRWKVDAARAEGLGALVSDFDVSEGAGGAARRGNI